MLEAETIQCEGLSVVQTKPKTYHESEVERVTSSSSRSTSRTQHTRT